MPIVAKAGITGTIDKSFARLSRTKRQSRTNSNHNEAGPFRSLPAGTDLILPRTYACAAVFIGSPTSESNDPFAAINARIADRKPRRLGPRQPPALSPSCALAVIPVERANSVFLYCSDESGISNRTLAEDNGLEAIENRVILTSWSIDRGGDNNVLRTGPVV